MTAGDRGPALASHEDHGTASFLRGLTIGALIGAIIAGSSIWTRRRRRQRDRTAKVE